MVDGFSSYAPPPNDPSDLYLNPSNKEPVCPSVWTSQTQFSTVKMRFWGYKSVWVRFWLHFEPISWVQLKRPNLSVPLNLRSAKTQVTFAHPPLSVLSSPIVANPSSISPIIAHRTSSSPIIAHRTSSSPIRSNSSSIVARLFLHHTHLWLIPSTISMLSSPIVAYRTSSSPIIANRSNSSSIIARSFLHHTHLWLISSTISVLSSPIVADPSFSSPIITYRNSSSPIIANRSNSSFIVARSFLHHTHLWLTSSI